MSLLQLQKVVFADYHVVKEPRSGVFTEENTAQPLARGSHSGAHTGSVAWGCPASLPGKTLSRSPVRARSPPHPGGWTPPARGQSPLRPGRGWGDDRPAARAPSHSHPRADSTQHFWRTGEPRLHEPTFGCLSARRSVEASKPRVGGRNNQCQGPGCVGVFYW